MTSPSDAPTDRPKDTAELARLTRMVGLFPDDLAARMALAQELSALGLHDKAISQLQVCLARGAPTEMVVNEIVHLRAADGSRGELADFADPDAVPPLAPKLLIACFPKSGSTLLLALLTTYTGFRWGQLCPFYLQNEQELDHHLLVKQAGEALVVQQHLRASRPSILMMQAFDIRPIVLVRNLYDTLASMRDFLVSGATMNTYLPADFADWPPERQLDSVIDFWTPWYLTFYASWEAVRSRRDLETLWLRYEELAGDKTAALQKVLTFYGIAPRAPRMAEVIATVGSAAETRRSGAGKRRGAEAFTPSQRARVESIARTFTGIDLSPIGL